MGLCLLFYYATNVWTNFWADSACWVEMSVSFPIDSRMQWRDWTAEQQFGPCSWSPLLTEGFPFLLAFVPSVMTADLWGTVQPSVSGHHVQMTNPVLVSVTGLSPCEKKFCFHQLEIWYTLKNTVKVLFWLPWRTLNAHGTFPLR